MIDHVKERERGGENVYVAARFGDWKEAADACDRLRAAGHTPTATWIGVAQELGGECARVTDPIERRHNADLDLRDVERSHVLLALVPATGGTGMWIEVGYAIALRRVFGAGRMRVLAVGPARERSIFMDLEEVEIFESVDDAIAALSVDDLIATHIIGREQR